MRRYTLEVGGKPYVIDVQEVTADRFTVHVGDEEYDVRLSSDADLAEALITPAMVPARPNHASPAAPAGRVAVSPRSEPAGAPPPLARASTDGHAAGALTAPMPGKILSVEVGHGDRVSRGQTLVILEAMKMKNAIKSPCNGVVLEVKVRPDQTVAHGDLLVQLGED
jgi:biotin carboxyl carrier protein